MDGLCQDFEELMIKKLDSAEGIRARDLREVCVFLYKFRDLQISAAEADLFSRKSVMLFVLLNRYVQQFDEITAIQHFQVRRLLETFFVIVETTKMWDDVVKKVIKIIGRMAKNFPQHPNIKEFFRIYSPILDRVSQDVKQKLAAKNKSLRVLFQILTNTPDIETQAVIMEGVIKLFKYNIKTFSDQHFLKIFDIIDVSSVNRRNMYQHIRMTLDHLNAESEHIFSINCSSIKLDSEYVLEFRNATNMDDIWLDFNMTQKRLSFFCDNTLLSKYNEHLLKYRLGSTWEVLSFCAKDVLNPQFQYNDKTEHLKISLRVASEHFSLFASLKFGRLHRIEIRVSRYSSKFPKLVDVVLPQVFPTFSAEMANVARSRFQDDSVTNIDVEIDQSSPVLGCSRARPVDNSEPDAAIIVISDDEHDDGSGHRRGVEPHNSESEASYVFPIQRNEANYIVSTKRAQELKKSDRSASPLSFSESIFNKSTSKNSDTLAERSRVHCLNQELLQGKKVSARKQTVGSKIASYTPSSANVRDIPKKKRGRPRKNATPEDPNPTIGMSHISTDEVNLTKKVTDWLGKVPLDVMPMDETDLVLPNTPDAEVPTQAKEMPDEGEPAIPRSESNAEHTEIAQTHRSSKDALLPTPTQNTVKSSELPPEERIERLMGETGQNEIATVPDQNEMTDENLLDILEGQSGRDYETGDSDVPLSALKSKWGRKSGKEKGSTESSHCQSEESFGHSLSGETDMEVRRNRAFDKIAQEHTVPEVNIEGKNQTASNVSIGSSGTETPGKRLKRKLYNPNDYSYLSTSITDEYLKSTNSLYGPKPVCVISGSNKRQRQSKASETKRKKSHTKKVDEKPKRKPLRLVLNKTELVKKEGAGTFAQVRERFLERMKKYEEEAKKSGKKAKKSFSSLSGSPEPFGVSLEELRKKKKETKAGKKEQDVYRTQGRKNNKINIISNILLPPLAPPTSDAVDEDFSAGLVKIANENYLRFIQEVKKRKPGFLESHTCKEIANVLQNPGQ